MDTLDKKIASLFHKTKRQYSAIKGERCLNDRSVINYHLGECERIEKRNTEQHLLVCDYCLDLVIYHRMSCPDMSPEGMQVTCQASGILI